MAAAAVHGYTTAFYWSAAIFAVGAILSALVLRGGVPQLAHGPGRRAGPRALISPAVEPRSTSARPCPMTRACSTTEADFAADALGARRVLPRAATAPHCVRTRRTPRVDPQRRAHVQLRGRP